MKVRWGRVIVVLGLLAIVAVAGLCALGGWLENSGVFDVSVSGPGALATDRPAGPEPTAGARPRDRATREVTAGGQTAGPGASLEPFRALTLAYTPYMATLALMDAGDYMERRGYDLQLSDAYAEGESLDEQQQCEAVVSGEYDALATTVDATRKCGDGVAIGVPIGQSAGNDAIVVKPGVETWNDVFEHAVAFTGYSVSEYMACFASHTANQPMKLPLRYDDAAGAVDAWLDAGAEQDIQSVVAWQPEVARALESVPGSRTILSSENVRILWDVIEFSKARMSEDPEAYQAFTDAYYEALLDLSRDPRGAYDRIAAWAADDPARQALLTVDSADAFVADLGGEAFATLRDAAILMKEKRTLLNRLDEAAFYWSYCGVDVPPVADAASLVAPEFVLAAREDAALVGGPDERPGSKVFQVSDFTNASAVTDQQIEDARVLFQTGVVIEFLPNRTDFRDPEAATTTLGNAVRFLRTCQECVLEVQGGAAYPGERVCPGCRREDSDQLAVERGLRVYDELRQRFDVPEAQLRFVETPHAPAFPGSNSEEELRQDRRTFMTGYQLGGR